MDKMAADMAVDFRGTGVATVSIWMGILLTERLRRAFDGKPDASQTSPGRPKPRSSPAISSMHCSPIPVSTN